MIEGSVVENVLIWRDDIPLVKVTQLLSKLGLMPSINHFRDGLDTRLSVNAAPLSTTQVNLLRLARGDV